MKRKHNLKRLLALLLCTVVFLGALPLSPLAQQRAGASSWAKPYVDQLREWGVLKGDGSGTINPGERLTRARMVAMLNRAFGFRTTGPIPFTDVKRQDWFYDDICIGYTEGVFNGESPTKANPNGLVTREQALTLMGRCMRLEENVGEVTEFTDGREFSSWSAPFARSAVLNNLINGFADGSFRPKGNITVGEMAKMLSIGIGNLINTPGVYPVGGYPPNGVFGNLTINTNNVTLRDVTIAGDLFLTGGVGLGGVVLDNVRVLGRIIIAGGGNSESAEASIILNNVEGHKLIIDPATGQFVSVRAVGGTNIPETQVSCNAYIQDDVRDNQKGLQKVYLEAQPGANFVIAGNMKDVYNKTPESTLTVGDTGTGSVSSITVDEEAKDSVLDLEINAVVDQVHLDTSAQVTGKGDIGQLNVNEDGSVSEILPDKVVVRPGVITEIAGIPDVDSEKAKEISSDPNILSGYPKVRNIAPTSADGVFSVNKAGTLYWALTNAAIGPLGDRDAEAMIHPSYGSGFMQFDNIEVPLSKTEHQVTFSGLDQGGTYYISAVLEDAHGRRSPVKSQEFTTPDGSVPAMSAGFPTIADRTPTRNNTNADTPYFELVDVQATVMATKTCDLYYVLLPAGSTQPQPSEFLSHSFPDPFGYGRVRMIKNAMDSFRINEIDMNLDGMPESLGELEESTSYDLYLWLTDSDGTQSSSIIKQTITTKDITPPKFNMETVQTATQATSVQLTNSINETGTVYWVAVDRGADYPVRRAGDDYEVDGVDMFLYSDYAKLQVVNGLNGLFAGKVAAQANKEFKLTISGLQPESAYDVYYLAADATGNYSDPIQVFTVHTLDETPPVARQEFEEYPEDSPNTPYADSTIRIIFNEDIIYRQPTNSTDPKVTDPVLLSMYQTAYGNLPGVTQEEQERAQRDLRNALKDMIILLDGSGRPVPVYETGNKVATSTENAVEWVVDYNKVQIYLDGAELVVSFPTNPDLNESALNLQSGARYQFQLQNIADNSERHNVMGRQTLPIFETVSAQVEVNQYPSDRVMLHVADENGNYISSKEGYDVDMAFTARPRSTSTTADGVYWDMLLWFDITCEFELYTRVQDPDHRDDNIPWRQVTSIENPNTLTTLSMVVDPNTDFSGVSLEGKLNGGHFREINLPYDAASIGLNGGLNDSDNKVYDFAIRFVRLNTNQDRDTFNVEVNGQVTFVSGNYTDLGRLAATPSLDLVMNGQSNSTVKNITYPTHHALSWTFTDGRAPQLNQGMPTFDATDTGVTMGIQLDRFGTVYYVMSPVNNTTGRPVLGPTDINRRPLPQVEKYFAPDGEGVRVDESGNVVLDAEGKIDPDNGTPNGKTATTGTFDNSDENDKYHFDYPVNLNIVTPTDPDVASPLNVTGSVSGGTSVNYYTITGLAPSTTYYVYLVTKGVSDVLSDVTAYQFTTNPITRPKLSMEHSGASASINSDMDATVVYKLIPYTDEMYAQLKQPFKSVAETEAFAAYKHQKSAIKQNADGSAYLEFGDEDFTVVDAIIENIFDNRGRTQGSLFDLCANTTIKNTIAMYIDSSADVSSTGCVGKDTGETAPNSPLNIPCDQKWELSPVVEYCMIAYGWSGSGDNQSSFAFTGTRPIVISDRDPIHVIDISHTLEYTPLPGGATGGKGTITGELVVTFDDDLHYLDTGATPNKLIPLDAAPAGTSGRKGNYESVEGYITSIPTNVAPRLNSNNVNRPLRTLVFDVGTGVKDGSSIIFFPNLSDSHYNPQSVPLNIKMEAVLNPDGTTYSVQVTIPTIWDRRGTT